MRFRRRECFYIPDAKDEKDDIEEAIAIFCICDEIVKSYGFHESPACKMTNAEVMTFAIISW